MKIFYSHSPEETERAGEELGKKLLRGSVVTLDGPLGAGKTTFVKGVARSLGVAEVVTSPSFTIISEYCGDMPLYHMDLYRIGSVEEFEAIGPEEMIDGNGVSIIEWAHKAESFFPSSRIAVTLNLGEGEDRIISIEGEEW